VSAAQVAHSVGNVTTAHLARAGTSHAGLPKELLTAMHAPEMASGLCYALVLHGMEPAARPDGLQLLRTRSGDAVAAAAEKLLPAIATRRADGRLALVNLAIPALKSLPGPARKQTLDVLHSLIVADQRFTLFEFALLTILREHLEEGAERDVPVRYFKYEAVQGEIRLLLSVLSRAGSQEEAGVRATFGVGMAQFVREPGAPLSAAQCTFPALEAALRKLEQLSPLLKKSVVEACADCVIHDGRVLPAEAELLQAVAVALDCPMPPLLAA
jgi:hypothetical protein